MHSLNICHIDIKQENIMYSHEWEKFVFIDFGTSYAFEEHIEMKTWTSF